MGSVNDISKYTVSPSDTYFVDNSVWMHLFCPIANTNEKKQKEYSAFLADVQSRKAMIFITSMVLSEFANRFLRLDFNLWKDENKYYDKDYKKDYLGSDRYKEASLNVISNIKSILKVSERHPDDFHSIDINAVLESFKSIDFNDSYYIQQCSNAKLKIVTDDKDFLKISSCNVPIISSL